MSSTSSNSSFGRSTSTPSNMYSAQSDAALAIAEAAAALGEQVFQWATNTQATDTAMTNAAVQNYLNFSGIGLGLAQQQLQQYEGTYVPEMQQLASEAGSYSSAARQNVNAGAAESNTTQGVEQGLDKARMNLQSYGINPSSGMYGELEEATNAAGGAAAAGAGQEAALATQATGRQLLGESIQVGQQLPGMTVNDLNSAYQGVAGAENATLANAQTGANLFDAANPFLSTAMQLRYPPVGNTSQSTQGSQGSSSSSKPQSQQQSSARQPVAPNQGGGAYRGGGGGGTNPAAAGSASYYAGLGNGADPGFRGGSGAGSIAKTISIDPNAQDQFGGQYGNIPQGDVNAAQGGSYDQSPGSQNFDPYSAFGDQANGSYGFNNFVDNSSNAMPGGGQGIPYMDAPFSAGGNYFGATNTGGQNGGGYNAFGGAQNFDNSGTFDASGNGFNANDYTSGNFGDPNTPTMGGGASSDQGGGYGTQGGDYYTGSTNGSNSSQDGGYSGGDYSGGGGYSGGYGGYARGGAIPLPGSSTGGQVPRAASPSRGRQTDDIPARLNAGEFVVPKDVAAWKGHEFFQKMIAQSRKARMQASAKPQMKAPLPNQGKPTFVSRQMGR